MNFLLKLLKFNQSNKQNCSQEYNLPQLWDGLKWLTPGCDHLSLKAPLCWEKLSHTKDNQPNNTRKRGWFLTDSANTQFPIKMRTGVRQTKLDNLEVNWAAPNKRP